jgi:trehalose 6-phosphate phosphatase
MASSAPSAVPPPAPSRDWALFLDVDGCLLDFAGTPAAVHVPTGLTAVLDQLHAALGGALALVSGRPLAQLDDLFAPLHLPAAGLHGLQIRSHDEAIDTTGEVPPAMLALRFTAQALAAKFPGALVEDKGTSLALHWRGAPAAEEPLHEMATSALTTLPGYHLQAGNQVIEVRPDGAHKGAAITHLLASEPFAGRTPVFVGDDLTDEHGFAAVHALGGISILVGGRLPSAARFHLHDPAALRDWLREVAAALSARSPAMPPGPEA